MINRGYYCGYTSWPHTSALDTYTIQMVEEENMEKVKHGFVGVVYLDDIMNKVGTK